MNFFKKIFNKDESPRQVTEVTALLKGDVIALSDSFALPETLRQQEFIISSVNSYEYEHDVQTEWVLTGSNNNELYLSIDIDDQIYLKFALKISHDDIESLFDLDAFSEIFNEPGTAFLDKKEDTHLTQGWTSPQYQQRTYAKVGYFHRKDHRTEELSAFEGKEAGEAFELYTLLDEKQERGIELEVWEDGDTDVFLTFYRPSTDITSMYPGS